jgi:predicted branched-subunit amino acid permease
MGPARGRPGFWATGLAVFACWNAGTLAGALGSAALADPRALGLDAAAPAAFLAVLAPRLTARSTRVLALAAAAAALVAVRSRPPAPPCSSRRSWRSEAAVTWTAVLLAAGGCYLLKLTGLSVPRRALEHPRVERAAARVPVALLAA